MDHDYTPHQLDPDETLRTVPAGWDLSGMAARTGLPLQPASLTRKGEMETGDEANSPVTDWQPEKFDSLRTTPRWWDVSNLR